MGVYYGLCSAAQVKHFAQAVCTVLGGGDEAVSLLCETAATETGCGTYADPTPNGAGRGAFQCDPIAFKDVVARSSEKDLSALKTAFGFDLHTVKHEALDYSPLIAAAVCRLHYKLCPGAIPLTLKARAEYWKKYYNTKAGKGTAAQYVERSLDKGKYF